ncbi:nucleic-acid-binding protein from transposon X-element [Trichonephila inaurata madagascariensis]|uniref:Nucleic-acid-binding protein from transposon X-element n=1 Tax=Trichonephila inaurata madagascariensis TaxID=2747483 RepID=A0A8X6IG20_9ARAC|nr:nucleic-acid-binding protein from transposon X-element [Trichonephila inaurata madagascariensis]
MYSISIEGCLQGVNALLQAGLTDPDNPIMQENTRAMEIYNKDTNTRNRMTGKYIKLYTDTFEQYHTLNTLLETLQYPFYTITPKNERPIKVVIKGLPRDTKISDIHTDLIDLGFTVNKVTQIIGYISKPPLPLFTVTLPRNINNAKIFDIKKLSFLSITVECFESRGATQCFQCNQFNHTAERCHLTPKCLKCGNDHQTMVFQIKRVDTLFCINCQTYGHMANYTKCPLYHKPRKGTNTKTNYTNIINSLVRPNTTYAQITQSTLSANSTQQMAPQVTPVAATSQPITQETVITHFQ